jgi:hypothetical protein
MQPQHPYGVRRQSGAATALSLTRPVSQHRCRASLATPFQCPDNKRFDDLPVWQEAIRLARRIHDLTENPKFKIGFIEKLHMSAMSIATNAPRSLINW